MKPEQSASSRRRDRRIARAEAQRRRALSPIRILFRLSAIPFLAAAIAISVYIRTSDYDPTDALRHLIALAGCEAAASVQLAPAFRDGLGYHPRNDRDGDGIACASYYTQLAPTGVVVAPHRAPPAEHPAPRMDSGAKFLRP